MDTCGKLVLHTTGATDIVCNHTLSRRLIMATTGSKYRARTESGDPDPIDVHVGGRLRLRRTLMGLSQTDLAKSVGLTFQQVQKYESGANRVSASRLYHISESLDVPVSFFFDDMPREGGLAEAPRPAFEPD